LHGCTQTASSYSIETQWNDLADRHKFYVAYGEQTSTNNSLECFNYYVTSDVTRGQGEALSLKQITDYMKANYSIDTTRVFVTGLSAGAAMTCVMCCTYPDVFSAAAEMSGLPYGCATSQLGADAACLGQVSKTPAQWGALARAGYPGYTGNWPRLAIFHGTADETVNNENASQVIDQFTNLHGIGQTPGYTYSSFNGNSLITLQQYLDSNNRVQVQYYAITNMAHGTAVYPGSCYQQGGATDNLAFNEQFYSPFWAAQFFGILQLPYSITGLNNVTISQQALTYSVPNTTGSTYTWTVPTGATIVSGQGTNSITVNWGSVSGTISVTEVLTGGCEQGPVTLFVTTSAQQLPDAGLNNITDPAASLCNTSFTPSFTLNNSGSITITSATIYYAVDNSAYQTYNWTGSLTASQSATITLPSQNVSAGSHVLTIYCSSPNGGTDGNLANDTVRKNFTAGVTPVVNLGNNITQCGGTANLNAQNAGSTYMWSNGATSQTVSVSQSNTYAVTVSNSGCSATGSISVTINPVPVVNLTGGNFCASQVPLNAGNSGSTYSWNTTATTQTIIVSSNGNYTVTVTSAQNCSASAGAQVNLNAAPAINLGPGGPACGSAVILDAGNPGATFAWSTGATTEQITSIASGTYSVTVTGGPGCSSSASVDITLNPVPVISLGAGGAVCGGSFALNAGDSGSVYLWSTGETTRNINANSTGAYTVTVTNANNCSASASVSVVINPSPTVTLNLEPDSVCSNAGQVTLQGAQPPGGTFLGAHITGNVFDATAAGPGTYAVAYGYTDSNDCSASAQQNLVVRVCTAVETLSDNITITVFPNPNATGTLYLQTNSPAPGFEVKIFDAPGRMVAAKYLSGQNSEINVSNLNQGVYILSMEGNGVSMRRILVLEK
jgi:poly(hydroxyalkanoate) depolymerase family esterase